MDVVHGVGYFRAVLLSVAAPRASLPFVSADSCWTRLWLCRLCTTTLQSDLHFISFQHRLLLQQQLSWVLDWSFSFTLKERWSKFVSCLLCRCYPGFVHYLSGSDPSSCSELQQLSYQLQQHCALGVAFPCSFVTSLLEVCTLSLEIPSSVFKSDGVYPNMSLTPAHQSVLHVCYDRGGFSCLPSARNNSVEQTWNQSASSPPFCINSVFWLTLGNVSMPPLAGSHPGCLCPLSVGSAGHSVQTPQCLGLQWCHWCQPVMQVCVQEKSAAVWSAVAEHFEHYKNTWSALIYSFW